MLNSNWSRWIQQSLIIYFKTILTTSGFVHVVGRPMPDPDPAPRFELKINGPTFNEQNACWLVDVSVEILVVSFMDDTDVYQHDKLIGFAASSMDTVLPIKTYGDDNIDFESLVRVPGSKVSITKLELAETTGNLLFSLVESDYRMLLNK